jgi:hypothetical protein
MPSNLSIVESSLKQRMRFLTRSHSTSSNCGIPETKYTKVVYHTTSAEFQYLVSVPVSS